jgi:cell wall-associated NlpC family hydrolase
MGILVKDQTDSTTTTGQPTAIRRRLAIAMGASAVATGTVGILGTESAFAGDSLDTDPDDSSVTSAFSSTSASAGYYKPDDDHSRRYTKGTGAQLIYSTSGSAIVNGVRVRFVWENLHRWGHIGKAPNHSTLTYGPELRDAVTAFQRKQGLKVDGAVGPKTWKAINKKNKTDYPMDMDSFISKVRSPAKGGDWRDRVDAMVSFYRLFKGESPYTWGGMGYKDKLWAGFDCSGLVYQMVSAGGIVMTCTNPVDHARRDFRSTRAIYRDPRLRTYKLKERRDGDIITFSSSSSRTESGIAHDGIFYKGYLIEAHSEGLTSTKWDGGDIHRHGYSRYVMPKIKRPFV